MTGWMPDVVPDAPVESAWGNKIRNRSITPFNTLAERDAYITAPVVGMECYVIATDSLYYYNGTAWKGRPRGRIAYLPCATQYNTAAANTWTNTLQITITPGEPRLCAISALGAVQQVTAAANVGLRLLVGVTNLGQFLYAAGVGINSAAFGFGQFWTTIPAAATSLTLQMWASAQQLRMYPNDATYQSYLAIEDLGTP